MHRLVPALLAVACAQPLDPTVVIVVLDGTRAQDSFGDGPSQLTGASPEEILPASWKALVPDAARATAALNLGATITAPAHCALVTGRRVPLGNYEVLRDDPGLYRPELPTVLEAVRDLGVERNRVVVLANTSLIQPVSHSVWPLLTDDLPEGADFILVQGTDADLTDGTPAPGQDDVQVLDVALDLLKADDPPRLMLVNLHQVDRSAHFGEPGDYEQDLRDLDQPLARFWRKLQHGATKDEVHLFVIADHGRHTDVPTDPPWQHHGDQCLGCRHIPLLALGPGVRRGDTIDAPIQLVDLGATAAELLGAPLPYADGRVATELFQAAIPPGREGLSDAWHRGEHDAELEYLVDTDARTRWLLDGQDVSTPGAIAVEALAVHAQDGAAWACARELTVGETEAPWVPRCLRHDGAGWVDVPAPEPVVGPFWTVAFAEGPDGLLALYPHNPNGIVRAGITGDEVGVRLATWTGEAWSTVPLEGDVGFPVGPSLAVDGAVGFAAVAGSPTTDEGRYQRRIYGQRLGPAGPVGGLTAIRLGDAVDEGWRLERPAVRVDGAAVDIAAIATAEWQTAVALLHSDDAGLSFGDPVLVELGDGVLPHVTPVWVGDRVAVAALDGGGAAVCATSATGGAPACHDVDAAHLLTLSPADDGVLAVIRDDDTAWEAHAVPASALEP